MNASDVIQVQFLREGDDTSYTICCESPLSRAGGPFALPYCRAELPIVLKALEWPFAREQDFAAEEWASLRRRGLAANNHLASDIQRRVGRQLYQALCCTDALAGILDRAFDQVARTPGSVHLALRFDAGSLELARFPWELIHTCRHDTLPLALTGLPILRSFGPGQPFSLPAFGLPLRVLIAVARPADYPPLDQETITGGLHYCQVPYPAAIDELRQATFETFADRVRGGGYHIVHFDGHGHVGNLVFEDEGGGAEPIGAREFGLALHGAGVRLAVLSACQSGVAGDGRTPNNLVTTLLAVGVPAVVAMQMAVPFRTTAAFFESFYRFLAEGQGLEGAMAEARVRTALGRYGETWFIPVLYLRTEDAGQLFPVKDQVLVMEPSVAGSGLPLGSESRQRLESVRRHARPLLAGLAGTLFEDHGLAHVERVLGHLEALLGVAPCDQRQSISPMEAFVLAVAAILHNIGLCFPYLSESSHLQAIQPTPNPDAMSPGQRFALLSAHWHELAAEMVVGSVQSPELYPCLGLNAGDPVELIADLVRALPLDAPPVPEMMAAQGQVVRLRLLVALFRLAASLDIAAQEAGEALTLPTEWPLEARLRRWMRYYVEAVRVDKGRIRVFCRVPSAQYIPHVANAHYDFFVRRWLETAEPLLSSGWTVIPLPPQIELSALKDPLPPDLWAIMQDRDRLREALCMASEVLAEPGDELPFIEPYYYGAVLDVPYFAWNPVGLSAARPGLVRGGKVDYQVSLLDLTDDVILWKRSGLRSSPLPYPADASPLQPGQRYRWTVVALREGWPVAHASGDFWLFGQASRAALTEAEAQLADEPDAERLLAMGLLHVSAGSYGPAVKCLRQALLEAPDVAVSISAHRALADLYERLYYILDRLNREGEADRFLGMAQSHYYALRRLLVAGTSKAEGGKA